MAKDVNKIIKVLDHLGEGTFSEIDEMLTTEDSVKSVIDKDLMEDVGGDSLDLDLDALLSEDLSKLTGGKGQGAATAAAPAAKVVPVEEPTPEFDLSSILPEGVAEKPAPKKDTTEEPLDMGEFKLDELLPESPQPAEPEPAKKTEQKPIQKPIQKPAVAPEAKQAEKKAQKEEPTQPEEFDMGGLGLEEPLSTEPSGTDDFGLSDLDNLTSQTAPLTAPQTEMEQPIDFGDLGMEEPVAEKGAAAEDRKAADKKAAEQKAAAAKDAKQQAKDAKLREKEAKLQEKQREKEEKLRDKKEKKVPPKEKQVEEVSEPSPEGEFDLSGLDSGLEAGLEGTPEAGPGEMPGEEPFPETAVLTEAAEPDFGDFTIDDTSLGEPSAETAPEAVDTGLHEDLAAAFNEDIGAATPPAHEETEEFRDLASIDHEMPDSGLPEEFMDLSAMESLGQEEHRAVQQTESDIDLSDEDIHIIINTLKNYPSWLANEVKTLILNDALSPSELQSLLDLLSNNVHWKAVSDYLKTTLNIDLSQYMTPEEKVYIASSMERALPYIKWGAIFALVFIMLGVIGFYFVYIPHLAHQYYDAGYSYLFNEGEKITDHLIGRGIDIEKSISNFWRGYSTRVFTDEFMRYGQQLLKLYHDIPSIDIYKRVKDMAVLGENAEPTNLSFYVLESDLYFEAKEYEKSLGTLEDLLTDKVMSTMPELYTEIARKYVQLGRHQEAVNVLYDGLRKFKATFDYYMKMLASLVAMENIDFSKKTYDLARSKFPKMIDNVVFTEYALLVLKKGKEEDTDPKEVLDLVLKNNKNFVPAWYAYSLYFEKHQKMDLALDRMLFAEKLINNKDYSDTTLLDKIDNKIGELYYGEGESYYHLAFQYFDKAIENNPSNGKAYYNRGKIYYFYENNLQSAMDNFQKAEKYGYTDDLGNYMMGWISYHNGQYEDSLLKFLDLELKYLDNVMLKLAIGDTHIKFGKPELAVGYLQSFISYWEGERRRLSKKATGSKELQNTLINLTVGYNNIGVAYAMMWKDTKNGKYESEALRYFLKSKEIYSNLFPTSTANAESYVNSYYILHPKVKRDLLLMDSTDYFPKNIFPQQ